MAVRRSRSQTALGKAMELGLEFGACVIVGVGIGYLLDDWLGTEPWLLLAFMFLGFGAGLRTVLRFARQSAEQGESQEGPEQ